MKDYGLQRSTVEPQTVEITESKVFIATGVEQIEQEYQFNLAEYDKDEYIRMIDKKNADLEQQVTDTQIALCDVYEMIGG